MRREKEVAMVAGHLQEKNGYFYAVLSYKDAQGKRKTKWIPTGYLIRGNKKKAEAFLMEQRQTFQLPAEDTEAVEKGELFADYLERWLKIAKSTIAITTYSSYDGMMKSTIVPWFRKTGVTITKLTAQDIQDFYTAQPGAGKVQHGDSLSCPHSSGAEICGKDRPAFRESSG